MRKYIILLIISASVVNFSLGQNVGIGTTNPTEKLTVDGTTLIERNSSATTPHLELHETEYDYSRIKFSNNPTSSYFTLAARPATDLSAARFNLYNSAFGANVLTVTGNGRLGVNKFPSASFQVDAVAGTDPLRIQNNNSTKFRIFSNNAMSFGDKWDEAIPGVFWMKTPNLFVGFDKNHIPEERLEVDGVIKASGLKIPFGHQDGYVLTSDANGNASWTNANQNQTLSRFFNDISISGGNTVSISAIANSSKNTFVHANDDHVMTNISGEQSFRFGRGENSAHLQFLESNANILITGSDQPTTEPHGYRNISMGSNAGETKISGNQNIILGVHGTNEYNGASNILIGEQAGYAATSNISNISIGKNAGASAFGNNNVSIGTSAGFGAGEKSINIGYLSGTQVTEYENGGSIGAFSVNTADEQFVIGSTATIEIGGYVPWSNLSDGRFKEGIVENVPGLQFINALRPVTYVMNTASAERFIRGDAGYKKLDAEFKMRLERRKPTTESGFIAQEVEKAAQSINYDFNGVLAPQNDNDPYALAYSQFVVPLVKAVQELHEKNQILEKQNQDLEARLKRLEDTLFKN